MGFAEKGGKRWFCERSMWTPRSSEVRYSNEIEELADAHVNAGVVSVGYRDDAMHVAAATVGGARAVVSWNFGHLVNIKREDGFNSVNILHGYPPIRIISPWEVIRYDEES